MKSDEQQIRELVATWMTATKAGDIETVLELNGGGCRVSAARPTTHDRKVGVRRGSESPVGSGRPQFDGTSEIQEIKVIGEWAFMWAKLSVVVTSPGGALSMARTGHTLSILKKQSGKWVLARDANMLSPVSKSGA
ncbi:MAG: nuclear transport factor 2 family protein [Nitrospirota bacterium]